MFQRIYLERIIKRVKEPRMFIQVLMGPRQVGKTTLINQLLQKISCGHLFESADNIINSDRNWIQQLWETARFKMQENNAKEFLLIIDEIQKIDNWSEVVKQQWDKDTRENCNIKVILLGSSRLLLQQGLTESLAGRFETTYIPHWSFDEMYNAFGWTVEQYVWFGGYPGAVALVADESRWKSYIKDALIETSISKDILMLTRIDKPALMKRLFELGSNYSGQILSFTKILGQLKDAGNTTTLSHYLDLLSDSGLLGGLEKYSGNMIRKRSSSPKFQVYNNALMSALRKENIKTISANLVEWGRMVESAIGAHLINHSITEGYKLYYWREGNHEVDFVMEKHGQIVGLEIKSGNAGKTSGMNVFAKQYNPHKIILIGNNGGLSVEEFLKLNPAVLLD